MAKTPPPPATESPEPVVTRLECTEDGSSKFWEGSVAGVTFTARWGRIGTAGQSKDKDFASAEKATAELNKLIAEKLGKGYVDVGGPAAEAAPAAVAAPAKAAPTKATKAAKVVAPEPEPEPAPAPKAKGKKAAAPEAPPTPAADAEGWVTTEDGYQLRLVDGVLQCKNAKGKLLATVPPKVKQSEAAEGLVALADFLAAHEAECKATVDGWMLGSLPVPRALLAEVWADVAWRGPLENAVVAPIIEPPERSEEGETKPGGRGAPPHSNSRVALEYAGLFRGVDPKRGLGLVNLDGESVWVDANEVLIPHPILLAERDDWRQLATELGIQQQIQQLFRETFDRPAGLGAEVTSLSTWSGAWFEQLNFALGRSKTLGYRVRGGFACCRVREPEQDLRVVEARLWIGSDSPEEETETGELIWVDPEERPIPIAKLGPVAISEGIRMASAIFAGRMTKKEED